MRRCSNFFQFIGYLGAEPTIRFNPNSGEPIATIPLGVDASYKDPQGNLVESVDWMDLTVYRKGLVDVVQKYTHTGSHILVTGHSKKRVWASKDRKDERGQPMKESRIQFIVDEIKLLGRPKDQSADPGALEPDAILEEADEIPF